MIDNHTAHDDDGKPKIQIHPAAEIFPLMSGEDFEKLKADIEKRGMLSRPAYLLGQLLDGRNRQRACEELGIEFGRWRHDLADDTETARSTPPEVTEEPDDPARDIDLLYSPPHPVAATELAAGMLIDMDGQWVTIAESSVDGDQVIVDWESAGDDSGTLILGTQEATTARKPLDD